MLPVVRGFHLAMLQDYIGSLATVLLVASLLVQPGLPLVP